jgi:hypothetical protein
MPGIIIDMFEGVELLSATSGIAQLGAAPLRNIPNARNNVAIRSVNNRADIAGTYFSKSWDSRIGQRR